MKSYKEYRFEENLIEKTFHDVFKYYFDFNDNIDATQLSGVIFGWNINGHPIPNETLTEREEDICLNFAQWLGSSVGQGFLFDCGFVPANESLIKKIYNSNIVFVDGKTIKDKYQTPDIVGYTLLSDDRYAIVSWEADNRVLSLKAIV